MQSSGPSAGLTKAKNLRGMLSTLPPELLTQIITHIETARTLLHLSLTCKRIRAFVKQDGFRVFVQIRFPHIQFTPLHSSTFWQEAAHGLTTLERSWERKAFIAWSINPRPEENQDYRRQRAYFRTGQTMGFVPAIDSYEAWYGGDWSSRKEVVAWSTGAGLVLRVKIMGKEAKNIWESNSCQRSWKLNNHKQLIKWVNYKEPKSVEGRDDITSVHTLESQHLSRPEQVIIGRASGSLSLIALATDAPHDQAECLASFETAGRTVRSTCKSASSKALLAACISDSSLVLYPLDNARDLVSPIGEVSVLPAGLSGRTWSSRFLNHEKIAVGHGPSQEPIKIYDIGHGQLTDKSVRSLSLSKSNADERLDAPDMLHSVSTSVYSLASINAASSAGGFDGGVFLSGAYDGLAR